MTEMERFAEVEVVRGQDREHLDVQITTAKRFPRSIQRFVDDCLAMATKTEAIAEECMYAIPRDGKTIEGPSARLGEIVLSAWKNCAAGARVDREDALFVYATGFFFDIENNVRIQREVRRRITDRNGRRYGSDMIAVTGNAACAIAQRNAVFAGIPKAFWNATYLAVRDVIAGDLKTLATRRAEAFQWMQRRGVDEVRVLHALGRVGVEDVTPEDFVKLKGMMQTVIAEEATLDEMFPDPEAEARAAEKAEKRGKGIKGLKDKIAEANDSPTTEAGEATAAV